MFRHIPSTDQGDKIEHSCIIVDEKDSKKTLFKKKSTSSACAVRFLFILPFLVKWFSLNPFIDIFLTVYFVCTIVLRAYAISTIVMK